MEDDNLTGFFNVVELCQLDNWRATAPIKTAGITTFFDQMNETLDYTEDKTTRGANKKRKEMEKSPFYNIYTSVDLTPQEAFDMDVKLEWVYHFV